MPAKINKGIILINLGSPDSTKVSDVRKYLNQFLMDERVIDKPWLLRALLVQGIIVPFRAPKSAEAYEKIWTKEGSPLIVYTEQLRDALEQKTAYPVEICMRYGNPEPDVAFNALLQRAPEINEVIVLPLYPHYAMSSYETAVEWIKMFYAKKKYPFQLNFIAPFYNDAHYIKALSESIRPYLSTSYDQLLFSYHGIPERHIRKSDITGCHCLQTENCCEVESPAHQYCYRHQVRTTTRLVTQQLQIPLSKYGISFQSRLGKGWLTPFTDFRLKELPHEGVKNLLIVCPAFVSDCLETLEEIAMRGKEIFLEAGGESFTMIPCINTHPLWIEAIESYVSAMDDTA